MSQTGRSGDLGEDGAVKRLPLSSEPPRQALNHVRLQVARFNQNKKKYIF